MTNLKKLSGALGNLWSKFEFSKVQELEKTLEEDSTPYGKFIKETIDSARIELEVWVHVNRFSKGTMVDVVHEGKNIFHKFIDDNTLLFIKIIYYLLRNQL